MRWRPHFRREQVIVLRPNRANRDFTSFRYGAASDESQAGSRVTCNISVTPALKPRTITSTVRFQAARVAGYTLIEVMITVGIVALLAGIAIPSYRNYEIRGQLVPGTNALLAGRTAMEQYYQDNRTYLNGTTCGWTPGTVQNFTLSCSATSTTYTITATGTGPVVGFQYGIDQNGVQYTYAMKAGWAGTALPANCFLIRKGQTC